jgi:hypothetical protein
MFNSYKYQKYKYKYTQLKRSISQSGGFNVQFILFGDVMTGHDVWFRDEFGNNIDFIERLQSIGDVIILKPNYVNFISYTNINNPKDLNRYYKTNDTNIFFHLNDLQFEIYADWVYKQINPNKQYIAIGLEQGAHFAKFFCNQYASNCISLYIIIDRIFTKNSYEKTFESEQNYEKLREFTGQQNIEKYKIQNLTDETIQFILHHIEDTHNDNYIDLLNGLCKGIIRSQYYKVPSININTIIYSDINVLTQDKLLENKKISSNDNIIYYYIDNEIHYYPIHSKYSKSIIRQIYGNLYSQ